MYDIRIVAYSYHADIFCPECIVTAVCAAEHLETTPAAPAMAAEDLLNQLAEYGGIDRDNETSFDSDDFPKVVLGLNVCDGEHEHCADCGVDLCGAPEPADRASERVGAELD